MEPNRKADREQVSLVKKLILKNFDFLMICFSSNLFFLIFDDFRYFSHFDNMLDFITFLILRVEFGNYVIPISHTHLQT